MTSRSLLPPRGIFVPTQLIFHPQLPASVLVTWIQLRCLAWQGWVTPPLSMAELASLTGIHPARLHRHLSHLQGISVLSWRTEKQGKVIITFPEEPFTRPSPPAETPALPVSTVPDAMNAPSPTPVSYFPTRILGYLSYDDEEDFPAPDVPAGMENRPVKVEREYARQVHSLCSSTH